jgi:malate synthase
MVRPRGWHLDEKHVLVDGAADVGVAVRPRPVRLPQRRALAAKDRGPYFYLPKLQAMEEAQLWDDVLAFIETALGLPDRPDEGDRADRDAAGRVRDGRDPARAAHRIAGLNCGRWDYIFSYIKTFRRHRDRVLPERAQVTMTQPFLKPIPNC